MQWESLALQDAQTREEVLMYNDPTNYTRICIGLPLICFNDGHEVENASKREKPTLKHLTLDNSTIW